MKASLYIHIPFCRSKCAYCDFESYAGRLDRADEYISRVLFEAKKMRDTYGAFGVPSVFIGGGTPSLLSEEQLSRLMDGLSGLFPFDGECEITMEANPGTISREKAAFMKNAGINRVSFGAQAAQEHILRSLGRIHLWEDVENAVFTALDSGIENINLDLMYALPGQTQDDFLCSCEKALRLPIKHLSLYSLILEEGTPLYGRAERGEVTIPGDEESVSMQAAAIMLLEKRGMKRYEISNYAYPGYECRHNIVYWTRENYLGLGCAAHSLMNEERFFNPDFEGYMKGSERESAETIGIWEQMEETIMLETRLTRGLDLNKFENRFGKDSASKVVSASCELVRGGFAVLKDERLSFTREGLNVQNALVVKILEKM